jgi:hypothetical protein
MTQGYRLQFREVERSDYQAGFFSRYFLIPKKDRPQGAQQVPPPPKMQVLDGS